LGAWDINYIQVPLDDVIFSVAVVETDSTKDTIFFLHGFPEGWSTWYELIPFFANNYNLVIPDQRGYNLTSKPDGIAAYTLDKLVHDVITLLKYTVNKPVHLVAHDWGGLLAWTVASQHPGLFLDLTIIDAPHPNVFIDLLRNNPEQQALSQYILFFQNSFATGILSANNFALLQATYANETWWHGREGNFISAWSQPNEIDSILNWYRANIHPSGGGFNPQLATSFPDNLNITIPTLVLWGQHDVAFLLPENLERLTKYVTDDLLTVKEFAGGTHWLPHEFPQEIATVFSAWVVKRQQS